MTKSTKSTLPSVVVIGGGTGTFVVLKGMKLHSVRLSAIVTMSDSGGSNKRIRDEFGLLPTSDIRQCFVALSDENGGAGLLRQLFMYRFDKGVGLEGMTFGNLFMAALSDILGSQKNAIQQTGKVLKIKGTVLPVSYTDTNLIAEYEDGHQVSEEHFIDEPPHDGTLKITNLWLEPEAQANPDALQAIANADLIVLGPGDLYTSLLPNLLVSGVAEAIKASKAKKAYVLNLMTKYGQTYNYTASQHIQTLEKHIGQSLTHIVVNDDPIPQEIVDIYTAQHEYPVVDDLPNKPYYQIIRRAIVGTKINHKSSTDALKRSLIRHDSIQLASSLMELIP